MSKRRKGPAGQKPPKAWVAEPYRQGQIYYDPTRDPGPLRIGLLWFKAKYPNLSCLLVALFWMLFILGMIAGYIWLTIFAFTLSDDKTNGWLYLGIALVCLPFVALLALWFRYAYDEAARNRSLLSSQPSPKKSQRRKRASDGEQPPTLFDPDDPAGFAQMLPYHRVRGLPKMRKPRSKSQKKEAQPQKSLRPRRRITKKLRAAITQKLSEDDC
jgi:hypothetical protein